jgi:hypothetical protein
MVAGVALTAPADHHRVGSGTYWVDVSRARPQARVIVRRRHRLQPPRNSAT